MKRAWPAVVFAVAMVTAIAAPPHTAPLGVTTPVAQASGPPTQVLGLTNLIGALFRRQRVYDNAADVQNEIRAYYDELVDSAKEAVSEGDLSIADEQLKAYIRIRAALEVEKNAALQLLEDDKRGARRAFQNTLNQEIPSLLLAIPGIRDAARAVQTELGQLRDLLDTTRQAIAEGRPSALLDLATHRQRLDQYAAIIGAVGGDAGSKLAEAYGTLAGQIDRLAASADRPIDEIAAGLADAQAQLDTALSGLDGQLRDDVRPVTIDMGAFQVRIPGRYVFYAAVADALSAHGGRQHGLTRDAMRDRVRQFLIDTKASELDRLKDCYRASAAQLRAGLSGLEPESGAAAALLLTADLKTCDPDVVKAVLAAAAELEATTTTVTPVDITAPGDTTADSAEPDGDRIRGGSIHQVTSETPDLLTSSSFCLDYSEQIEGIFRLSLTACTDSPYFNVVHDLDAGTIAGRIELDLECPGLDLCFRDEPVVGTVSGSFGPFTYGRQPDDAPADWPFPAHHWYSGATYWWAGGPIELEVAIAGTHYIGEEAYPADVATTITGWAESTLSPTSSRPGELPTEWTVDLRVNLDYGETVEPRWDFSTGYFWTFEETGVDIPSWRK